jgi:hypothetical protein
MIGKIYPGKIYFDNYRDKYMMPVRLDKHYVQVHGLNISTRIEINKKLEEMRIVYRCVEHAIFTFPNESRRLSEIRFEIDGLSEVLLATLEKIK